MSTLKPKPSKFFRCKRKVEGATTDKAEELPYPDYLTDPNAVLGDIVPSWRYGKAPDYSNTRRVYAAEKKMNHESGSLPDLIENLVKNWEIEASFKRDMKDMRTIDNTKYTFSVIGGTPQSALYMSKMGTYNAVIPPNEFFSPEHSDFNSSHKTFKRMMPTFTWEVIEVYSPPPIISFKWRHWGTMTNDYVGFNDEGEKVTAKAHGQKIDFTGMTVARLSPEFKLTSLEIWYDPLEMFRQITRDADVTKEHVGRLGKYAMMAGEDHTTHLHGMDDAPKAIAQPETPKEDFNWGMVGLAISETTVVVEETTEQVGERHGNGMGMGACPYNMGGFEIAGPR